MSVMLHCDAGPGIGLGHVLRGAALGAEFARTGRLARMRVPVGAAASVPDRVRHVLPVDEEGIAVANGDIAVVDSYRPSLHTIDRKARLIAFHDGDGPVLAADFLVNAAAVPADYAGRTKASCRLLLGPRHASVDAAFAKRRTGVLAARASSGVRKVLVSFGGDDAANATGRSLDVLAGLPVEIDVALGAGARHVRDISARASTRVRVHVDTSEMPALMADADIAVGAAGSTAWERCALGLPALVARLAANQNGIANMLVGAGAAMDIRSVDDGFEARLAVAFERVAGDRALLASMAARAAALCDGRGTKRIVLAVAGDETDRKGGRVRLRAAESDDAAWLHDLQSQPETRRYARNPAVPTPDEHRAWFAQLLANAARTLAIVECADAPAGFLRLDPISEEGLRFEVSIAVDPAFHGMGIGSAALRLARACARDAVLEAEVHEDNRVSRALFAGCGYRQIGPSRLESRPA